MSDEHCKKVIRILKLSSNCKVEEIEKARRGYLIKNHPDRNPQLNENKLKNFNDAYTNCPKDEVVSFFKKTEKETPQQYNYRNSKDIKTQIITAIKENNLEQLKTTIQYLQQNTNEDENSVLFSAFEHDNKEIIEYLINEKKMILNKYDIKNSFANILKYDFSKLTIKHLPLSFDTHLNKIINESKTEDFKIFINTFCDHLKQQSLQDNLSNLLITLIVDKQIEKLNILLEKDFIYPEGKNFIYHTITNFNKNEPQIKSILENHNIKITDHDIEKAKYLKNNFIELVYKSKSYNYLTKEQIIKLFDNSKEYCKATKNQKLLCKQYVKSNEDDFIDHLNNSTKENFKVFLDIFKSTFKNITKHCYKRLVTEDKEWQEFFNKLITKLSDNKRKDLIKTLSEKFNINSTDSKDYKNCDTLGETISDLFNKFYDIINVIPYLYQEQSSNNDNMSNTCENKFPFLDTLSHHQYITNFDDNPPYLMSDYPQSALFSDNET